MSWTLEGGTDYNDTSTWQFDIGDTVRAINSPADAGKSTGLVGVVTNIFNPVKETWVDGVCVACKLAYTYSVKFPEGPTGQQVWSLAFREVDLELVNIDLGGT